MDERTREKETVPMKKQVTFHPFVAIKKIVPLKGANLWYQQNDFQRIKDEIRRTINTCNIRSNKMEIETGKLCTRGLEDHLVKNTQVVRERRMKTTLIVLLEHDRQLDEEGVLNCDKLAWRLKSISHRSAQRARQRALNDELLASRIYDSPLKEVSRPIGSDNDHSSIDEIDVNPDRSDFTCVGESSSLHCNLLKIREQNPELSGQNDTTRFLLSSSVVSTNLLFCAPNRSFQEYPRS